MTDDQPEKARHAHPTHRTQVRIHQPPEFFPTDLVGLMVTDPEPGTGDQQFLRYRQGETVPTLEWVTPPDAATFPGDWSQYPALTVIPAGLLPSLRDAITAHLGDAAIADQVQALQAQVENAQRYAADLEVRLDAAEKVQEATEALTREKDAHLASQDRHLATLQTYVSAVESYAAPQVVHLGDSEAGPLMREASRLAPFYPNAKPGPVEDAEAPAVMHAVDSLGKYVCGGGDWTRDDATRRWDKVTCLACLERA